MIISISGTPGSGKSTIAKFLEIKLKMPRYYMGGLMRQYAKEHNMTIEKLNDLCLRDSKVDKDMDSYQAKLGKEKDNFIIEGRTSWHFILKSLKIFVYVDVEEAAKRIFKDESERNEKKYHSVEHLKHAILERMTNDSERYRKYYQIEVYDPSNYDVVIDTTGLTIEQAEEKVLEIVEYYMKSL